MMICSQLKKYAYSSLRTIIFCSSLFDFLEQDRTKLFSALQRRLSLLAMIVPSPLSLSNLVCLQGKDGKGGSHNRSYNNGP